MGRYSYNPAINFINQYGWVMQYKRRKRSNPFDDDNARNVRQRIEQKNGESYTKTLTKEKEEMKQESSNVGVHRSFLKVNSGNPKVKRVVNNCIDYQDTYKYETEWLSSEKKHIEACFIGTKSQYLFSSANISMASDSYQDWFSLNPLQGLPASTEIQANLAPAVDWISVDNGMVYMDFINETNLPCQVKVEWFKAKTDGSRFMLSNYALGVDNNALYTTANIPGLQSGSESCDYTGASATAPSTLSSDVYTNIKSKRDVNMVWKPLSSKTFYLAGGDIHRLTNFMNINIFQCKSKLNTHGEDFPQGCLNCVISYQGLASHFKKTIPAEEAFDGIGFAPGKVGVIITRKLKLKPLKAPNERFDTKFIGNNNTLIYGKAVADAQIIGNQEVGVDLGEVLQ